jgi:prefoldin subunit 5
MDSICPLSEYLKCPCTYLSGLLPDISPYWRSDVVMIGIAVSTVGTILSLIQGYTLIALISFVATCILSFAFYYVEAYITMVKMEEQINAFKAQVSFLKGEIGRLGELLTSLASERAQFSLENTRLTSGVLQLNQENTSLQEQVSYLQQINELMNGRFTSLTAATTQVNSVMEQLTRSRMELQATTLQLQREGERFVDLNRQCAYLEGQIGHLQEVAHRFSHLVDTLQTTVSENMTLAPQLRSSIEELRTLIHNTEAAIQAPLRMQTGDVFTTRETFQNHTVQVY